MKKNFVKAAAVVLTASVFFAGVVFVPDTVQAEALSVTDGESTATVSSLSVKKKISMKVGKKKKIKVKTKKASIKSSNKKVVGVKKKKTGKNKYTYTLTAKKAGKATVTYKKKGKKIRVKVTVKASNTVSPAKITSFSAEADYYGVYFQWTATGAGDGYIEFWRSQDGSNWTLAVTDMDDDTECYDEDVVNLGYTGGYYYKARTYNDMNGTRVYSKYTDVVKTDPIPDNVTIADFMDWVLEEKDTTDEQKADIENAQEMLSDYVADGTISMTNRYDAIDIYNLSDSICILLDGNTFRVSDENYNGYIFTDTPTLSTNFTMMVGSAYTANVSSDAYTHVSSYASFAYWENLVWRGHPIVIWGDEVTYFNECRDELGYTAPVNSTAVTAIQSLAESKGYTIGHYTNMLAFQDAIWGAGSCRYDTGDCYSANGAYVSVYEKKGYAVYLVSDYAELFKEFYNEIFGTDPF